MGHADGRLALVAAAVALSLAFELFSGAVALALAVGGYDPAAIGLLVGMAGITQLVAARPFGRLTDYIGPRVTLGVASGAYVGAALLLIAPLWIASVVVSRALLGVGIAAFNPGIYTSATLGVDRPSAARRLALVGAVGTLGAAVGAPAGVILVEEASVAAVGVVAALIAILGLVASWALPHAARPAVLTDGMDLGDGRLRVPVVVLLVVASVTIGLATLAPIWANAENVSASPYFVAFAVALVVARFAMVPLRQDWYRVMVAASGASLVVAAAASVDLAASDLSMIVSGAAAGAASAMAQTAVYGALGTRGAAGSRGSALSLITVCWGVAVLVGGTAAGAIQALLGTWASAATIGVAAAVVLGASLDRDWREG